MNDSNSVSSNHNEQHEEQRKDITSERTPLLLHTFANRNGPRPAESQRSAYPHARASLFSRLTFSYLQDFFSRAQPLEPSDLFEVPEQLSSDFLAHNMFSAWDAEMAEYPASPSLARALFKSGAMRSFLMAAPLKLLADMTMLASPVVFGAIIGWFSTAASMFIGFGYVVALFVLTLLTDAILLPTYYYECASTGIQVDRSLALLLQRKALRLASAGRSSSGELVSLLSVDCQNLNEHLFMYLHMLWSAPLQVGVCVFLLLRLVGKAALFGVAVMLTVSALAVVVAGITSKYVEKKMKVYDERLRRLSELFEIYRQVKMFAWERIFQNSIRKTRNEQLAWTLREGIMDALGWGLWDITPVLTAATTFAVASSSWFPSSPPLTPSNVFPALAIFEILTFPLTIAPEVFQGLVLAKISLDRLTDFLTSEEVTGRKGDTDMSATNSRAAAFSGGNLSWGGATVLRDVTLEFPVGKLTMIIGPVGAGKTSLLAGLLGEMRWDKPENCTMSISRPRLNSKVVGYVPQTPWVFNATVRENILFLDESPFDQERYAKVIDACGLEQDLSIMPANDRTEIGSRGMTLSGGQRARIGLARAVYARADIYIFDSTLAALDAHLAAHVFKAVLGPEGLLADKTRIFVTHSLDLCSQADHVVMVKDGRAVPEQDRTNVERFVSSVKTLSPTPKGSNESKYQDTTDLPTSHHGVAGASGRTTSDELEEDGGMAKRDIGWYVLFAGTALPLATCMAILSSQALALVVDSIVAGWTESIRNALSSESMSSAFRSLAQRYLRLMIIVSFICCVFQVGRQMISVFASIRIARKLHEAMLQSVLRAPVSFFDETPLGRLLNRFGSDMSSVDHDLPTFLTAGLAYLLYTALMVLLVCWLTPFALIVTLPVSIIYVVFTRRFGEKKRQLQRLASANESPLYCCFQESLAGMEVIRAFDRSAGQGQVFRRYLDGHTRASMMLTFGDRYFEGRIAVLGALSIGSAASAAILARGVLSPSLAALSVLWSFKVNAKLGWLPLVWSQIESGLVASDRLHWYISHLPQEEPAWRPSDASPAMADWPCQGEVRLESVCMRYRPQFPLALDHVSLSISAGQHIGIVGRSGSGKSSLMMALLRLVELESGCIVIDGVDIRTVGLDMLRTRVCVIPQEPALFRGTIRANVDPEGIFSDAEVWDALDRVQMRGAVQAMSADDGGDHGVGAGRGGGGLDAAVADGGHNLSAGERQLVALARVLCRRGCRLIVMDEASSNVDWATDARLQRALRAHLGGGDDDRAATVLTIAHRLRTVATCDAVVVLDGGSVVEGPAPPATLLADPSSRLSALFDEQMGGG